jgi:hypothetical protein
MSGFQSPQILTDLYRDLRDRRLLPLVLVLVVGMAVVPIALSSSSKTPPASAPLPAAPAAAKSNAPAEQIAIADPGLRDYQSRLKGDTAKDPFVQEFTTPLTSTAGTSSPTASSAGSSAGVPSAGATSPPPTTTTTPPTGGSPSQPQTQSKFFFYRVKVRAGQVGQELNLHDSVGSLTSLPSKKVPAVAFLGVTTNGSFKPQTAVFLVSSAVSSLDGEGSCTFAGTSCQLLSLKPGQHEDLVWIDGLVYRIDLVKFDIVVRNNPPAVAGQGSSGGGSGSNGRSRSSSPLRHHFSF